MKQLFKPKILFIDFDDSFSFNIIQRIMIAGFDVEVINYKHIAEKDFKRKYIIVLGPGPGCISDYSFIQSLVKKYINKVKILGICLGHQLILSAFFNSAPHLLKEPLHGESLLVNPPDRSFGFNIIKPFKAQFYNSWAFPSVDKKSISQVFWNFNNMLIGFRGGNTISFQFHPESVGTECMICPIRESLLILYNKDNV